MKTIDKVEVIGIPLFAGNIRQATEIILDRCLSNDRDNLCVSASGAHGLVFAKKNPAFAATLKSFFLNLPDGMPGVWVGRVKGAKAMERCYGPDFFANVLKSSKDLPVTHFFCGGNSGVAEALKFAVAEKFGNQNIVGAFCPPYLDVSKYDYQGIADIINQTKATIVWIGLSTPKQELFALNLSKYTNVSFIISVGAAFDFHTDRVQQAPPAVQKIGLEWLFRLMMEPRRLYKRYLEIVPFFIYYNLADFIKFAARIEKTK